MKLDISKGTIIVILFTIIVIILFTRITRSSYTAGTPANDASVISQPVFVSGNYQDIDPTVAPWSTPANYVLDTTNPSTWSQANFNCWAVPNCVGIRHNFDTHQTWQLMQPIGTTRNAVVSVNTPTVPYNGQNYSLPLSIVAKKSTQDPNAPVNCTWSPATGACSTSACSTPGTQTISWTIASPAAHGGTCSSPASTTVPCNTNNPCPSIPHKIVFSTVGTTTWTVPAGITAPIIFNLWGGGGGGGGACTNSSTGAYTLAGGGGAGGWLNNAFSPNPGDVVTITIGAGGAGGTASTPAGNGGDSKLVWGQGVFIGNGGGGGGGSSPNPVKGNDGGNGGGGCVTAKGTYPPGANTMYWGSPGVAATAYGGVQGFGGGGGAVYGTQGPAGWGQANGENGNGSGFSTDPNYAVGGGGGAGGWVWNTADGAAPANCCGLGGAGGGGSSLPCSSQYNSTSNGGNATTYGGGGGGASVYTTNGASLSASGGAGYSGAVVIVYEAYP